MKVHILSEKNSLLNRFLKELRDVAVQKDTLRFRANMRRAGQVMAYEMSTALQYKEVQVNTPLGTKRIALAQDEVVICSVLRAGLVLHEGLLDFFDNAENGFISAYRHHPNNDDAFEIVAEYKAVPNLNGKTLILADPMLATGQSLLAVYEKLLENAAPAHIHIAVVIAAPEGVEFLRQALPGHVTLWVADVDSHLDEKKYIVPGLGDAGDLAYGVKL